MAYSRLMAGDSYPTLKHNAGYVRGKLYIETKQAIPTQLTEPQGMALQKVTSIKPLA